MERLKRRTVISLAASYASQLGTTGAEFLTKIVLAWLIMPTQWGIFAEAMLIVLIADVFTDLGLSQHLVREKSRPFGNVLLLRSILALGAIAVVEVFAPYLKFFTPQLIGPTRALAPLILIKAVGMVPTVYVDRELIVQKSLLPQFARLALMAAVSIVLAVKGMGVWALVIGTLASELAYTVLIWVSVRKIIPLEFTLSHTRNLLRGSSYLFLIAIIGLLLQQGDILVTGSLLDPKTVGFYAMALMLVQRVSKVVETAIYRVIYPLFCEVSHDRHKLGQVYKCATLAIIAIEAPIYMFLLFHAGFVVSILPARWLPMAFILQALAMSGVVNPFTTFGIEVLRATKQDRMLFMASVSGAVALVAGGFILTHQFGPMGMVAANYLPVGAIFVIIAMLRTIRTQFLSLARQLAVVYVVSFTVSSAAFVFGGTGLTRHIAGILAVIVLWAFFYKKYGLTEGKETLGLL
ncbi:MAG TPA: oligosaccharide flippase family protein [Armatimonadota bacterium]|nr:oligosaccharide flippase family protein [Armatimonadota bacterium]